MSQVWRGRQSFFNLRISRSFCWKTRPYFWANWRRLFFHVWVVNSEHLRVWDLQRFITVHYPHIVLTLLASCLSGIYTLKTVSSHTVFTGESEREAACEPARPLSARLGSWSSLSLRPADVWLAAALKHQRSAVVFHAQLNLSHHTLLPRCYTHRINTCPSCCQRS